MDHRSSHNSKDDRNDQSPNSPALTPVGAGDVLPQEPVACDPVGEDTRDEPMVPRGSVNDASVRACCAA